MWKATALQARFEKTRTLEEMTRDLSESTYSRKYQNLSCAERTGHKTLWPTRNRDNDWFYRRRRDAILGCHEQGRWMICHGACFGPPWPNSSWGRAHEHGVIRRIKPDGSTVETDFNFVVIKEMRLCQSVNAAGRISHKLIGLTTTLLSKFDRDYSDAKNQRTQVWLRLMERRSNKQRFQYCSDTDGKFLYLRAIEGHTGGNKVGLSLQDNVQILYGRVKIILVLRLLEIPLQQQVYNCLLHSSRFCRQNTSSHAHFYQFCRVAHAWQPLVMHTFAWLNRKFRLTCDV